MTMPNERLRAVNYAREFMYALLDPKKTPKVPKNIRAWALRVLRHYPMECEMERAAELAPELFWTQAQLYKHFPNLKEPDNVPPTS